MTRKYYYIDSSGPDTNLQLYSLQQAKLYWRALEDDLATDGHQVEHFHERCVFLICTIGLSVSQLLGQNVPDLSQRVPSPIKIFESLVDKYNLKVDLKSEFKEFINTYDQCRHFGLTNNGRRHWEVSQLTFEKTRKMYEFGLEIWRVVISIYKNDDANDLSELNIEQVEYDV